MKTIQKLEAAFGLTTWLGTSIFFFVLFVRDIVNEIGGLKQILSTGLLFIILPEFVLALGLFVHPVKQRFVGLIAVLLGGIVLTFYFGLCTIFVVTSFYDFGLITNIVVVLSFLSAMLTIFFAILFTIQSRKSRK